MKKLIRLSLILLLTTMSCSTDDISNNSGSPGDNGGNNVTDNAQPTGASANEFLSDSQFTQMTIEIVSVQGFEPTQQALSELQDFLQMRLHKPGGINIESRSIASPGIDAYNVQDLISLEESNRTQYNSENKLALWIYFADGESAANSNNGIVLGTAYRNTSFVIFEETIHGLSDSVFEPDREILEATVILHEMGHLLGLTNLGSPPQSEHEDLDHPKHCDVEECLMYYAAETDSGLSSLIGLSSPPGLDSQCIADLQANGGK